MRMVLVVVLALSVPGGVRLWGFTPPVDEADGVRVAIEGVPETHDLSSGPLAFSVQLQNASPEAVSGTLDVWLNDDWRLDGTDTMVVRVGPGETQRQGFTAVALERALAAHYPVHAEVRLERKTGGPLVLHPIAVFVTTRSATAAGPLPTGLPGNAYECLRATEPVTVDGDLKDWGAALEAPLGQAQCSTGTVDPRGFDGSFRALHDGGTLYLAVQVADDEVDGRDTSSTDFMDSDYVRFYLSPTDPEQRADKDLTAEDLVLAVNVGSEGERALVRVPSYAVSRSQADLGACRFAVGRTPAGYAFEAAVPLSILGRGIGPGAILGANLMVGDADGGRRRSEVCLGRPLPRYWLTPASYFRLALAENASPSREPVDLPPVIELAPGAQPLDQVRACRITLEQGGTRRRMGPGWAGQDPAGGGSWRPLVITRGGIQRRAISLHPPYRGGAGTLWCDYAFRVPEVTPVRLEFHTAIRDHNPETEPPSDGVEFRVLAVDGEGRERELFRRFTAAKTWEPAEVDLSAHAGSLLRLRLWNGPGPANNTTCDSGYWGDPVLSIGTPPEPVDEVTWQRREEEAAFLARHAAVGRRARGSFTLAGPSGPLGASVVAGASGVTDAVLAFSDAKRVLLFRGFVLEIDGRDAGDWRSGARVAGFEVDGSGGSLRLTHRVETPTGTVPVVVTAAAREGALTLGFSMPGVTRDLRGQPRFTRLALGPGSEAVKRVYLGFGNVAEGIEAPFQVGAGGFGLSTRHVGADYANGLSLLQATDVYPDRVVCDPARNLFRLETPHDSTFLLVPSGDGAFAAARRYRDVNGFRPGRGVRQLLGRMCLDQWGGDYQEAARGIEEAARYGVTHAIFVKHAWQCWGYDYRLPEIYPPRGGLEPFRSMPEACRRHGILFAPHDNYIDFYPDAAGFSYDHIVFNSDGTPQRAWYNKGRQAQSYRWLPHAFAPWLRTNMEAMRDGFAPTGLFIDVFSAIRVFDYYDREGQFHTRRRSAREWADAFDTSRDILGRGSPMLSEAGHDALVGSLDGAQSDHYSADRWGIRARAATRTPWHDMASHGRFVLLAGGLGHRYGNEDPAHTYGTDDYLSNTVIGGRNPMCDGPFSRRAVMTYWLLHDVCDNLARAELEAHRFHDDTIFRQQTIFGDGSRVWTNRGVEPWTVQGRTLPEYGFWVETPGGEAGVFSVAGQRVGWARSGGTLFADARPLHAPGVRRQVSTKVLGGRYAGEGRFELDVEWTVLQPLAEGTVPFVHILHPAAREGENILHHGHMDVDRERLLQPGRLNAGIRVDIPADSPGGTYRVRYGLYNPKRGGERLVPEGDVDGSRARGGLLRVEMADGRVAAARYEPEPPPDAAAGLNREGRAIDFGPVSTNGAFRLLRDRADEWLLIPLPGSLAFAAELDLDALGARGPVAAVEPVGPTRHPVAAPVLAREGSRVRLQLEADAFAYRIRFER
ncbi:MAG: hypothetical protein JXR77_09015 [Lentisphaeria bacterium]|nr:hypothetical protein [Lentisphaeria bacterium]